MGGTYDALLEDSEDRQRGSGARVQHRRTTERAIIDSRSHAARLTNSIERLVADLVIATPDA